MSGLYRKKLLLFISSLAVFKLDIFIQNLPHHIVPWQVAVSQTALSVNAKESLHLNDVNLFSQYKGLKNDQCQ